MRKVRTAWPVAARVKYVVAFGECSCGWPRRCPTIGRSCAVVANSAERTMPRFTIV